MTTKQGIRKMKKYNNNNNKKTKQKREADQARY